MSNPIKHAPPATGHLVPVDSLGQSRVKPWAIDAQRVGIRRIDLTNARQRETIQISGDFLWIAESNDPAAFAYINFREDSPYPESGIPLKRGTRISGVRFDRILITNSAQPGRELTLIYLSDIGGPVTVDNYPETIVSGAVDIVQGDTIIDDSWVTVDTTLGGVLISAANPANKSLRISNNGENTVYIGGAGITVPRGIAVPPGGMWIERDGAAAAWYGITNISSSSVFAQTIR